MEVRKGYKKTELGIIPTDWILCKQKDVVKYINGRAYSINEWESHGIPVVRLQNLTNKGGNFYYSNLKLPEHQYMHFGDLIFMWSASFGPYIWWGGKAIYHYHIWKIECDADKIDKTFYYYKLVEVTEMLKKTTSGSTMLHLTKGNMEAYVITLPTKAEQVSIAAVLSDIDTLIYGIGSLISKKRNIKKGAMQQLLKPKEGWAIKRLEEVADVVGGGTPNTFYRNYWNGSINWFTPTEIGENKYTFTSERKITIEGFKSSSAKKLPKGAILLTSRASIGDVSILMNEGCTNQGFQSLIAKDGINNEFLYYTVLTLKKVLLKNASGSTFLEIGSNKIKQIEVGIPSLEEQTSIATILSDMDAEILALENKLQKYKKIKSGMMQSLLTGKIRLV